jgi:uncharacterized protein
MSANLNLLIDEKQKVIDGYGGGFFIVSKQKISSTIFITGEKVLEFNFNNIDDLNIDQNTSEFFNSAEIILVGTGIKNLMFNEQLKQKLKILQVPFEIMDTKSATRTYNALLFEGRKVGAVLFKI